MTVIDTSVSQYSLTVDASETIGLMVESADNPWGRRLHDALVQATCTRTVTFAVPPYVTVTDADVDPRRPDAADMPDVGDTSVDGVLRRLEAAKLVTTRTVLHESSAENYLSAGRIVTAVEVHRPFVMLSVTYSWLRDGWRTEYADRWDVAERSYIVPAGWYLLGEVGEFCYDLVGVAGMDGDSDDTFCWLFDLEGFAVSHCFAGCDSCDRRWAAEGGSWQFEPDSGDAAAWNFDDAESFDTSGTIACPDCDTGRVGFLIS